mmetsp:Transcript_28403/g.91420  ORF Transcript_28403/g.91420 Transcript_28403/m.91420 type:complete len:191 (+) Transcript_28403:56-628(+)
MALRVTGRVGGLKFAVAASFGLVGLEIPSLLLRRGSGTDTQAPSKMSEDPSPYLSEAAVARHAPCAATASVELLSGFEVGGADDDDDDVDIQPAVVSTVPRMPKPHGTPTGRIAAGTEISFGFGACDGDAHSDNGSSVSKGEASTNSGESNLFWDSLDAGQSSSSFNQLSDRTVSMKEFLQIAGAPSSRR